MTFVVTGRGVVIIGGGGLLVGTVVRFRNILQRALSFILPFLSILHDVLMMFPLIFFISIICWIDLHLFDLLSELVQLFVRPCLGIIGNVREVTHRHKRRLMMILKRLMSVTMATL